MRKKNNSPGKGRDAEIRSLVRDLGADPTIEAAQALVRAIRRARGEDRLDDVPSGALATQSVSQLRETIRNALGFIEAKTERNREEYERALQDTLEQVSGRLRRDYYRDVASIVEELRDQCERGEFTHYDGIESRIEEEADGNQWVIYTFRARQVVTMLSQHDIDETIDELGRDGFDFSQGIPWSSFAFYCLKHDIESEINDRWGGVSEMFDQLTAREGGEDEEDSDGDEA
jgi:hypothetical protein